MRRAPQFFAWLAVAAVAEWLVARTLTRSAIFMPKSPPVAAVYQGLSLAGQLAFTLAGVLALAGLGWLIWQAARAGRFVLGVSLAGLLALGLVSLVIPPAGWLPVIYHLLALIALGALGRDVWQAAGSPGARAARAIPVLALLVGTLHQGSEALAAVLPLPLPSPGLGLFYLGELLVVASGACFWWIARQRGIPRGAWLAAALPALAFAVMALANPAITGIMAIWSTGLTLYLPWPLYALSLYLASAGAFALLGKGDPAGWAVLLLAAGGYPPQLSTQVALGVIGLWLLGQAGDRAACASCGEAIINRREVVEAGRALCRACAGESAYRLAVPGA